MFRFPQFRFISLPNKRGISACTANTQNNIQFFLLSSIQVEYNRVFLGCFFEIWSILSLISLQSHIILFSSWFTFPLCKNVFIPFIQLMNETHFSMVLVNHFQPQAALPCLPKDHYLKYKLNNQGIYMAIIITDYSLAHKKGIKKNTVYYFCIWNKVKRVVWSWAVTLQ